MRNGKETRAQAARPERETRALRPAAERETRAQAARPERERRVYLRRKIAGDVRYNGSEGLAALAIDDMSIGGIRLQLSGPEQVGRDVLLQLALPGDAPLEVAGRVVWARQAAPYATGIRFLRPQTSICDHNVSH